MIYQRISIALIRIQVISYAKAEVGNPGAATYDASPGKDVSFNRAQKPIKACNMVKRLQDLTRW